MPVEKNTPSLKVSIVVPCYNESAGLFEFHQRLGQAIANVSVLFEIVYVDDGSYDDTADVICALKRADSRVGSIRLSRNFGKEYALTAGIDHVQGDAVIVIDADLQDPPECIPEMIDAWRNGNDVVAMKRADRSQDSIFKRVSAKLFYALLSRLSDVPIPDNVGDFRLLSRRAIEAVRSMPERNRYMKGLFAWIGYETTVIEYTRVARHAGTSKWPILKLMGLALDGITAFSIAPLRIASLAGATVALSALLYGLFILGKTLLFGEPVAGFPTLLIMMALLGGAQLLAIGLLGEYVGRLSIEAKQRPHYFIDEIDLPASTSIVSPTDARISLVR